MIRAYWHLHAVDHAKKIVFIVDEDGPRSVTNDAEAVCAEAVGDLPGYRLVYRDTDGCWDELVHDRGRFVGFRPCPNRKAERGGL